MTANMKRYSMCCMDVSSRRRVFIMAIIDMIVVTALLLASAAFAIVASFKLNTIGTSKDITIPGTDIDMTSKEFWTFFRNLFIILSAVDVLILVIDSVLIYAVLKNKSVLFLPWFIFQVINILVTIGLNVFFAINHFKLGNNIMGAVTILICLYLLSVIIGNFVPTLEYYKYMKNTSSLTPQPENTRGKDNVNMGFE